LCKSAEQEEKSEHFRNATLTVRSVAAENPQESHQKDGSYCHCKIDDANRHREFLKLTTCRSSAYPIKVKEYGCEDYEICGQRDLSKEK
jgi:hypothetical protein